MSPRFTPPSYIWLVIFVSTVVSAWINLQRHRVEASARAVHLAATIEDIRLVAAASGVTLDDAIERLKAAGLTALVVSEENFDQLETSGKIVPTASGLWICADDSLFVRIRRAIESRFPANSGAGGRIIFPDGQGIDLPAPVYDLKNVGVGFDDKVTKIANRAWLSLIVRVANPPAANEQSVTGVVSEIREAGAEGVIFTGDQVLGWETAIPAAAGALNEAGIWYGSVEFGNQAGDTPMSTRMLTNMRRVHSMLAAEMTQNTLSAIIDRYVRAATERNIRVLLLRPARPADPDPLASFTGLASAINSRLAREGSAARLPKPITEPQVPAWARLVVAAGVVCVSGFVWFAAVRGRALRLVMLALLAAVSGWLLATWPDPPTGNYPAKIVSLMAAIAFPTWAVVAALAADNRGGGPVKWVGAFFWVSLISVVGGLHVAALLVSLPYMLHVDQFTGVKVAHILPPLLTAGYLLFEQVPWRAALGGAVRWLDVGILVLVAAAAVLTVVRTGNEAPSAVGGWELQLRDFLDRVLPERPRTKEALLGQPALVVGLGLAEAGDRTWIPLAGLIAALGQASIVNTFCHLHTPVEVSFTRVLVGLATGGILGCILWLVIRRVLREPRKSQ